MMPEVLLLSLLLFVVVVVAASVVVVVVVDAAVVNVYFPLLLFGFVGQHTPPCTQPNTQTHNTGTLNTYLVGMMVGGGITAYSVYGNLMKQQTARSRRHI